MKVLKFKSGLLLNWHLLLLLLILVQLHYRLRRERHCRSEILRLGLGIVKTSGKISPEGIRTEAPGHAEDRGDQEVVEVGTQSPEGDENGSVDVPRLNLVIHLDAVLSTAAGQLQQNEKVFLKI